MSYNIYFITFLLPTYYSLFPAHLFSLLPQFTTVDGVLPQYVAAWPHRRERIEISERYPNGKSRILLTQRLTTINGRPEPSAYQTAHAILEYTQHQTRRGYRQQKSERGAGMHNVHHRGTRHYRQRASPQIEREVLDTDDHGMEAVHIMLDYVGGYHGQHQYGEHLR